MFIHTLANWPKFQWDRTRIAELEGRVRYEQGRLLGRMEGVGLQERERATLETVSLDVLKSCEIEGELFKPEEVRSSVARRLGIDIGALAPSDRNVDGVVELTLDATRNSLQPLTEERLFSWHSLLFPDGRSGESPITVGMWRTGPMQVVSGGIGYEKVHFQTPEAERVPTEMEAFFNWVNGEQELSPVLKAAIAHLWFLTVHPFDDGNGRIARAIADMFLARADKTSQRFYSMSAAIQKKRSAYYTKLESTQRGSLDITLWLEWFLKPLWRSYQKLTRYSLSGNDQSAVLGEVS